MRLLLNLRVERLERCLTQEEIADEIGVTQSTWSRAERGLNIEPASARKIAEYFERKPKEVWDFGKAAA
jgi:transcriptional regulator with XRE-family HTH domain